MQEDHRQRGLLPASHFPLPDGGGYWEWDQHRFPAPLSPFAWSIQELLQAGLRGEAGPSRIALVNGYRYSQKWPPPPLPNVDDATAMQRAKTAVAALPALWRERLRPELEGDLQHWRSLDFSVLPDNALFRMTNVVIQRHLRHWAIHDEAVGPVIAEGALLDGLLDRIYGPGQHDPLLTAQLVQGEDNLSWELARALAGLAEQARPYPDIVRALNDPQEEDAAEVLARLPSLRGGESFLHGLDALLDQHGYRSSAGEDYLDPLWREDPSFVLAALRGYLLAPPFDDATGRARLHEERATLETETLARCGDDVALRDELREMLALARAAWPVREDHSFFIEQQSVALVRIVFLEAGRRLVTQDLLARPDDIFLLTCAEVMGTFMGRREDDLSAVVETRRAEREAQSSMVPPPSLGTPPPPDAFAGQGWRGLLLRQAQQFEGAAAPREAGPFVLRGTPVSRGNAIGPVRVVRSPADFRKVRPGDVLVCPTTTPPWSPLFPIVAALVTEAGGTLSHAAIMAREHHLPAVTAVSGATHVLRDGQIVTVDGAKGEVRWGT